MEHLKPAGFRPAKSISGAGRNNQLAPASSDSFYAQFRANERRRLPFGGVVSTSMASIERLLVDPHQPANELNDDDHKSLELKLHELVLESSRAACKTGEIGLALSRARESLEVYRKLKLSSVDRSKRQDYQEPMSRGVSLFELSLMVYSNLAEQLRRNCQHREAIDFYGRLCKMAATVKLRTEVDFQDEAGSGEEERDEAGSGALSASREQLESKSFLLHRFGLNLGNIYHELGDHSRALKYYRLTLDRLASYETSQSMSQLRLKLMSNISLTLLLSFISKQDHRQSESQSAALNQSRMIFSETLTSLKLLLADNVEERKSTSSAPQSRLSANQIEPDNNNNNNNNLLLTRQQQQQQVVPARASSNNSNHHRFVSNLIVCHSLASSRRWAGTRALSTFSAMINIMEDHFLGVDICHRNHSSKVPFNLDKLTTAASEGRPLGSANQAAQTAYANNQSKADYANAMNGHDSGHHFGRNSRTSLINQNRAHYFDMTGNDDDRQASSWRALIGERLAALRGDKLELLIRDKQSSVYRALLTICDLIFNELEKNFANLRDENDDAISWLNDFSRLLLALNATYGNLMDDLKINGALKLVKFNNKSAFNRAVMLLESVKLVADQANDGCMSNNILSMYFLKGRADRAVQLAPANFDDKSLMSLANCYCLMGEFAKAKSIYEKLQLEDGIFCYNSALIKRKLGDPDIDNLLVKREKNLLVAMQMALIYKESERVEKSLELLNNHLLSDQAGHQSAKQSSAPELYLLASKLLLSTNSSISNNQKGSNALSKVGRLLQQANKMHPYHLPLLERLIALNINNFNYTESRQLLLECIKNRPDQVKWYQMLAECYRKSADYQRAIDVYKATVELFPMECLNCLKALIKLIDELGLMDEERKKYELKLENLIKLDQQVLS